MGASAEASEYVTMTLKMLPGMLLLSVVVITWTVLKLFIFLLEEGSKTSPPPPVWIGLTNFDDVICFDIIICYFASNKFFTLFGQQS